MKSGLEGRNNAPRRRMTGERCKGLNEVRPGRPEQSIQMINPRPQEIVSMKSGLEGRNNGYRVYAYSLPGRVSMKSGLEGRNNSGGPGGWY